MGMTLATRETLRFSDDNAKLDKINSWYLPMFGREAVVYSVSMPSGWTCPFAFDCLAKTDRYTGRIKDGKEAHFRCYAATMEARSKGLREIVWDNFTKVRGKSLEEMLDVIVESIRTLPMNCNLCRVHVGGDYFNEDYFRAWMLAAKQFPHIRFYSYTKSLAYWVNNRDLVPENFSLIASKGGRQDYLIDENNLRYAEVVKDEDEAFRKGLVPDYDERCAIVGEDSFALPIHNTQPKGNLALLRSAKDLADLRFIIRRE